MGDRIAASTPPADIERCRNAIARLRPRYTVHILVVSRTQEMQPCKTANVVSALSNILTTSDSQIADNVNVISRGDHTQKTFGC